jgi:hypothetical protein
MNKKFYAICLATFMLAILACSGDNVTGSSEDPNTVTAKAKSSSSSDEVRSSSSVIKISSSSDSPVLCKVSGDWGGCVKGGFGDLWSSGDLHVKTNILAKDSTKFGYHAGYFFIETDSIEGGKSTSVWNDGRMISEFGNGWLGADLYLDKGSLTYDPYVNIGFYVAGFDSNGVALSADISNWNGICVLYGGDTSPNFTLQLDLGDSINKKLGYTLPSVALKRQNHCYEWKDFKQVVTNKEQDVITGEDAAKHVVRVVFHFQASPGEYYFEILAIGTNRDE